MTRLVLQVDGEGDPEELARFTNGLRQELLNLDVAAVDQVAERPPLGARAAETVALGTLIVSVAQSQVLAAIINAVTAWLSHRPQRTVRLTVDGDVLELSGLPSKERQRLADQWLQRRAATAASTSPAVHTSTTGVRSALIIANRKYQDPGLGQLRAPLHDAEALAKVLGDPNIGGFDVRTLTDAPSYELCEAVEDFFVDRSPDDLLLMHFSGHGVKDESGELHFAAANTKLSRLGATAIPAEFVNRRMNRSRSRRIVLLLDCCYAGAFERGLTARAGVGLNVEEQFGGGHGRAVITASTSVQYAFEGDRLASAAEQAPSLFTRALVEGLQTGEADRDQDGQVALDELYDYVYDKVRQATPNQTPGKWVFGVQGDIYLARRARPVTTPAQLPGELHAAIDHPLARIRLGAVEELTSLLSSRHAGLALAARLSLQDLAQDDSRSVSAAATEALAASPVSAVPKASLHADSHSKAVSALHGADSDRQRVTPPGRPLVHPQRQQIETQDRPLSEKRRVVAGLLQICLGALGMGRFYTGHTRLALAQILATVATIYPVAGAGGWIWGLVDGILILVRGGTDVHGLMLRTNNQTR
ncbi:MAG TPA: caspase family protein [Kineosporiaceae bacterium]